MDRKRRACNFTLQNNLNLMARESFLLSALANFDIG